MKRTFLLYALALLTPTLASAADHNLGELAKANKIEVFNRTLDQTKADSPQTVFLNAAPGDGLAWIAGVEFSEGTIEVEIKGKNEQGRSFVGIAITPAPDPDSWVKLKLVVKGKNVTAFVNGAEAPALTVELLNDRLKGKVGLWVGNGSDGCFRNLKVIPETK